MRSLNRIGLALLVFVELSLSGFAQSGMISTVVGNGTAGYSGDGGPATSARLYYPTGVAVDTAGNLFIADTYGNFIRKVTPGGVISTVAGNGTHGFSGDGGPATSFCPALFAKCRIGLDEAAINTRATKLRFKPGTFKGAPGDVQANIAVTFRLAK